MNSNRRSFLKLTQATSLPLVAALATPRIVGADDGDVKGILGSWNTKHTLPQPPGAFFREFLSFSAGGVLQESNAFLHTNANLDFTSYGFPGKLNAADGFGNWERIAPRRVRVAMRKMLFTQDGQNPFDLRATGTLIVTGNRLRGDDWLVEIVEPFTNTQIAMLGSASTEGWKSTEVTAGGQR